MLEVQNLSVSYGRHRALEGVGVRVSKGEICVILGANGAGKSTLLKTIAGMVKPEAGAAIAMNGRAIAGMKPHRIVEEGIALVPEGRGIFGELTVAENLQLGAFANRARRHEHATLELIYQLFPRLAERKRQIARTMSGGEQQMVAIGRALMSKPDILMLDEPSLGLSPLLTKELFRSLKQVAATGVGILMVEQNARQSLAIADRGVLIENGLVTGEGRAADLATDPAVVSAYLGGGAKAAPKPAAAGSGLLPSIKLPPALKLPLDPAAWRGAIGDIAGRAGRVQAAFVRALRRDTAVPSAFAGRYDPKAGTDPWAELAQAQPIASPTRPVSSDAHRLGLDADLFAARAARIQAAYVRALRARMRQPSAFEGRFDAGAGADAWARLDAELERGPAGRAQPADLRRLSKDSVALARSAGERLSAHVEARRKASAMPSAFQPRPEVAPARGPDAPTARGQRPTASHGLIGHNSARFAVDDETARPAEAPAPRVVMPDPAGLAARAAAIQAAHVASRRKALVAFTLPAAPPPPAEEPAAPSQPVVEPAVDEAPDADIAAGVDGYVPVAAAVEIRRTKKSDNFNDASTPRKRKKRKEA
ncbi:ATP-binding cassette domain-containing protein [Aquibium microcysteis]|uniref:ATP-binding cassette domain-containing protein n=1 Tax=Aquibium microcysteis TaxID=675281 RepID=UPI00165CF3FB